METGKPSRAWVEQSAVQHFEVYWTNWPYAHQPRTASTHTQPTDIAQTHHRHRIYYYAHLPTQPGHPSMGKQNE